MKAMIKRFDLWFRQRFRQWLRQNPRTLRVLRRFRCFSADKESMSRGLAVGLFFGLTPTVGFQTPLVLFSCLLLGANFPAAFAATWINNPLTMAPLYMAFNWLGEKLIGSPVLFPDTVEAFPLFSVFAGESAQMLVGCLPLALPAAMFGYTLARWFNRNTQPI